MRYFYLVGSERERIIVDYSPPIYGLFSFPTIYKWQKFDAYIIPNDEDISNWERDLIDARQRRKNINIVLLATIIVRLMGIIGLFTFLSVFEENLFEIMKKIEIPTVFLSVIIGFILYFISVAPNKYLMTRKVPLKKYALKKKFIQVKVKQPFSTFLIYFMSIFVIGLFLILGGSNDPSMFIPTSVLLWLILLISGKIPMEAKVYIRKKWEKR